MISSASTQAGPTVMVSGSELTPFKVATMFATPGLLPVKAPLLSTDTMSGLLLVSSTPSGQACVTNS